MPEGQDAVSVAERELAVRLSEDYAGWLSANDGFKGDLGGCFLSLCAPDELVRLDRGSAISEFMPELVLIGTDGGGEGIGIDMRGQSRPVVLVGLGSLRWEEAIHEADSFHKFLHNRLDGYPFRLERT